MQKILQHIIIMITQQSYWSMVQDFLIYLHHFARIQTSADKIEQHRSEKGSVSAFVLPILCVTVQFIINYA